jgi:Protein of unknown function (DUF2782)
MRKWIATGVLLLATNAVWAKQPAGLEPLPEIPPPPGMPDTDLEPQITIVQRGQDRVEEFRIHGLLFMIRVTPPHGHPYYLIDQRGDGLMVRHDDLSPNFQVPMWVLFRW